MASSGRPAADVYRNGPDITLRKSPGCMGTTGHGATIVHEAGVPSVFRFPFGRPSGRKNDKNKSGMETVVSCRWALRKGTEKARQGLGYFLSVVLRIGNRRLQNTLRRWAPPQLSNLDLGNSNVSESSEMRGRGREEGEKMLVEAENRELLPVATDDDLGKWKDFFRGKGWTEEQIVEAGYAKGASAYVKLYTR
ncbi:hypothetical protein DL95DRAFT_413251 [Leptodontidium sp. 2 PMI_412]|nr:hypothetical protein DL95DRAFT_413251 [Leptodontidium sp. 2 PMI_412]